MGEQQYQSQKQQQQKSRQNEPQRDSQTQGQPPATGYAPSSTITIAPQASKRNPTLSLGELKKTAGRTGELSITLEKFWVQVGNNFPCGFKVGTRAENELEVTLEQLSYRRVHNGRGGLTTQVVPVEPIGTKGRVIARDITTGEIVEQPWQWHRIGPFSHFWNLIKNLLFKSR